MASLVTTALQVRRALRALAPVLRVVGLYAVIGLEARSPLHVHLWIFCALVAVAAAAARIVSRATTAAEASGLVSYEQGAVLLGVAFSASVRAAADFGPVSHVAVYLMMALVAGLASPAATVLCTGSLLLLEAFFGPGDAANAAGPGWLARSGVVCVAAAIPIFSVRAEARRLRRQFRQRFEHEVSRLKDDARAYRLHPDGPGDGRQRGTDDERLARSGVEEIHQSVLLALRLLREGLGLHTAMLLWLSDNGEKLRISELETDDPNIVETSFATSDGIFAAVLGQGTLVQLHGLKATYKLPYYRGACPVRALCAVPILQVGRIRGILVTDRLVDGAFAPRELELIELAGQYAARVIQNEQVFMYLERTKAEQSKLYRAAGALGSAMTEEEVINAGLKSAREMAAVDFAAVTLFEERSKTHEIRAVSGASAESLLGQRFKHNAGLVSMVLQNRHPLPYRGEYDQTKQVVFTRKLQPPELPSLVVLPLVVHDRPLGTLVLGSERRGVFSETVRRTLEVLASHMGVSLLNARMVRRLEQLATMDGLTGLFNKRALTEMAELKIKSAHRFGRRLATIVVDIDFFKRVNDTHGHDVGDEVIKKLGEILQRTKRATDVVARFGGEEFVVLCEETDSKGAVLLAERIRDELGKTTFFATAAGAHRSGTHATFQVTCSLGVATYPEAGASWTDLFKAADEALYASKRQGRNRTTVWSPALIANAPAA